MQQSGVKCVHVCLHVHVYVSRRVATTTQQYAQSININFAHTMTINLPPVAVDFAATGLH